MKVMAFNGSPRKKKWNTVTLLKSALEGAASAGAETELVQLYDLDFSGCISCFSCKKRSRKADGVCSVQDDLTAVLERVRVGRYPGLAGTPLFSVPGLRQAPAHAVSAAHQHRHDLHHERA
jgi:hypothetical protein